MQCLGLERGRHSLSTCFVSGILDAGVGKTREPLGHSPAVINRDIIVGG
jgi:hypothetical protein